MLFKLWHGIINKIFRRVKQGVIIMRIKTISLLIVIVLIAAITMGCEAGAEPKVIVNSAYELLPDDSEADTYLALIDFELTHSRFKGIEDLSGVKLTERIQSVLESSSLYLVAYRGNEIIYVSETLFPDRSSGNVTVHYDKPAVTLSILYLMPQECREDVLRFCMTGGAKFGVSTNEAGITLYTEPDSFLSNEIITVEKSVK